MRPASAAACRVCVCFQTTPPDRRLRASALLAPTRSPSSSFPPSCGEAAARGWLPPPPKGSAPRLLRFGGSRVRCSAMFSRISRIGARLLCEARAERRAGNLPSSGGSLYQAHASRYSTLMVSPTVLSLRNRLFSTATSSGDQDESRQEEEKITVTFVNKDSEQTISVPVGMSMLEAAHENDIELEGRDLAVK